MESIGVGAFFWERNDATKKLERLDSTETVGS
jgi:hypothetical protein